LLATGPAAWTSNVSRSHPAATAVIPHPIRYETVRGLKAAPATFPSARTAHRQRRGVAESNHV
jgi:hypothetical protein